MRIFFLMFALFGLALAQASFASTYTADTAVKAVHEVLDQKDADRLKELLTELDEGTKAGTVTTDAQRQVYQQFGVTRPDLQSFLYEWYLEDRSVYSATAVAVNWVHHAMAIRGGASYSQIHPKSYRLFKKILMEAEPIVMVAVNQRRDFPPAVETYLGLNMLLGRNHEDPLSIYSVMEAHPTPDVLEQMLASHDPRWGGNFEFIKRMCTEVAPVIPSEHNYSETKCKVAMAFKTRAPSKELRWARSVLEASDDPFYLTYRFSDALYHKKDYAQALALYKQRGWVNISQIYLIKSNLMEVRLGRRITPPEIEAYFQAELDRWQPYKEWRLKYDPFNANWLVQMDRILMADLERMSEEDKAKDKARIKAAYEILVKQGSTHPDLYSKRGFWLDYESSASTEFYPQQLDDLQRALLYANFAPIKMDRLFNYSISYAIGVTLSPRAVDTPPEIKADVLCRRMQIFRVLDSICDRSGDVMSVCGPTIKDELANAIAGNECNAVQNMSYEELFTTWPGFDAADYERPAPETENYWENWDEWTGPTSGRISGWYPSDRPQNR